MLEGPFRFGVQGIGRKAGHLIDLRDVIETREAALTEPLAICQSYRADLTRSPLSPPVFQPLLRRGSTTPTRRVRAFALGDQPGLRLRPRAPGHAARLHSRRIRCDIVSMLRVLPLVAVLVAAAAPARPAGCARDAMLVVDGSASMGEVGHDPTAPTRIAEARRHCAPRCPISRPTAGWGC